MFNLTFSYPSDS